MDDRIAAIGNQDGWQTEDYAARVHYRGGSDGYSVEYYAPSDAVLYWRVSDDDSRAVPVGRESVPGPLRTRIRDDLEAAGVDPSVEAELL